jgi:hypothetical protein
VRTHQLCGAKTRRGSSCVRKALPNGRCPNHGGMSTGPRTPEGRASISAFQRNRWARWREAKVQRVVQMLGNGMITVRADCTDKSDPPISSRSHPEVTLSDDPKIARRPEPGARHGVLPAYPNITPTWTRPSVQLGHAGKKRR